MWTLAELMRFQIVIYQLYKEKKLDHSVMERELLTPHSGINIGVRLLIFGFFSRSYVLIQESSP